VNSLLDSLELLRDEKIEAGAGRTPVGIPTGSSAKRDAQVNLGVCLSMFVFCEIDRGSGGGLRVRGKVMTGCEAERGVQGELEEKQTLIGDGSGLTLSFWTDLTSSTDLY